MYTAIVSGGAGAGKSTLMRLLNQKIQSTITWFSSDEEINKVYTEPQQRLALIEAFSDELGPDQREAMAHDATGGALKAWVRLHVLPFRDRRKRLEAILHPYVLAAFEEASRKRGGNLLVAEVPLHYEIGEVISADLVIVVAASRSVQVRRMMENRGLDEATAQAFLNAQWPIEAKVEKADVVIWNDGDPSALECQTLLLANLINLE